MERDEKVTSALCDSIWVQECVVIYLRIPIWSAVKK